MGCSMLMLRGFIQFNKLMKKKHQLIKLVNLISIFTPPPQLDHPKIDPITHPPRSTPVELLPL